MISIIKRFKKLTIVMIILAGFTTYGYANKKDIYKNIDSFMRILTLIQKEYVDEKSFEQLFDYAIEGMLSKLDPHSSYFSEKDFNDLNEDTSGKFAGVGMYVVKDKKTNFMKVVSPIDDTPAQKAGLKSGDLIVKIDDVFVDSISFREGVDMLKGKPNTKVTLKISRDNKTPFDVVITRAIIKVPSIKAKVLEKSYAHIKIIQFQERTTADLIAEVKKLNKDNKIKGYIIDLRNNPGGLLSQAIGVSDAFLEQGEIVSTRGRRENSAKRWNATKGDIANGKPIVLLVNGGSASASEIVAGALQDHKRAIVVGQKTFGKGSVQSVLPIGEKRAIKFTTARYYTPSGRSIQKLGVEPDVKISNLVIEDELGESEYSEGSLTGAISNDQKDDKKEISVEEKLEEKSNPKKKKSLNVTDYHLARALDTLKTIILVKGQK